MGICFLKFKDILIPLDNVFSFSVDYTSMCINLKTLEGYRPVFSPSETMKYDFVLDDYLIYIGKVLSNGLSNSSNLIEFSTFSSYDELKKAIESLS